MTTKYFNVKQGIVTGNITLDAASGNIANVGNISVKAGGVANLGNLATANFVTGTLTTSSQPNITSVGTLSSVDVTGNLTAGNANLGNLVTANFFSGNGSLLSSINGANITGTTANANYAAYAGNVVTAAQPNITSLGTLTGLTSTGIVDFTGTSNVALGAVGNVHITGGTSGYVLSTNGSGTLSWASPNSLGTAGSNTQVQFNDGGSFGADANFTYDKTTDTLGVKNVTMEGAGTLSGGNLVSANFVTGTLTTAAQPNITSVGTLSSLSVTGNVTSGNVYANSGTIGASLLTGTLTTAAQPNITSVGTLSSLTLVADGDITMSGSGSQLSGANLVSANFVTGTLTTAAQPNITSVGDLASLGVTGNATVGNLSSNGSAYISNGMTVAAGGASFTGNVGITGNLTVTGNLNYQNVTDLVVGDPLIYIGANNTANIVDLGIVASYNDGTYEHTGIVRDHTDGVWKLFDGVATEPTTVIDWANATYAPFKSGSITGTGTLNITGNANVGNIGANIGVFTGNVTAANIYANSGTIGASLLTGTLTTAAQPNITSVGTLSSLSVTANVTAGNVYANSGTIGASLLTGTLTTAAQPNITSVGTLSSLVVGNSTANVTITVGGANGTLTSTGNITAPYFIGNVQGNISGNIVVPGTNTSILFNNSGNAGASSDFTFDDTTNIVTLNGNIVTNNANLGNAATANYFIGNFWGTANTATTAGTVTTAAQPNITSVGTLTGLTSTGTVNLTGASNVSLGPVGNVRITGGTSGQYLQTDGTGTLSWATLSSSSISNGTSNVSIPVSNGNVNLVAGGNTTMVVTATGSNVTGYLGVTGNITASNADLGNAATANYFIGNLWGTANTATTAGTVTTAAQPNITSVGTLTSLNVSGNLAANYSAANTAFTSGRANVAVTTNTVIDQFAPASFRTAKYVISAEGDDGYQSVETLLIHDGVNSYVTIYGSICSNNTADIIEISSNVSGVSGNVALYATASGANTKVKLVATYIAI
jgi:hypothetical protein